MTGVPVRRGEDTQGRDSQETGNVPCEDKGRGWGDTAARKVKDGREHRNGARRGGSSWRLQIECHPATLILGFEPSRTAEQTLLL